MMHVIEGETADEVWRQMLMRLQEAKGDAAQSGRGGMTDELLHVSVIIGDPRQRWVVSRQPGVNPAFAIAEAVWILLGRKDAAYLTFWNPALPTYNGHATCYDGAYGYRLRYHFGIDQLERAYETLLNNPDSRQVVLQIWDAGTDLPDHHGEPVRPDIPCNVMSMLKIRQGKLEWMQIMRSNDLYRGTPYNFVQFTMIQEVLAGWLGVDLGAYHHLSDSLHLYHDDASHVRLDPWVEARPNTDSLALSKTESVRSLALLDRHIDALIAPNLMMRDLVALTASPELPAAFHNLLLILAAEAARRRGWEAVAHRLAADCSNPALVQLWQRWTDRFRSSHRLARATSAV